MARAGTEGGHIRSSAAPYDRQPSQVVILAQFRLRLRISQEAFDYLQSFEPVFELRVKYISSNAVVGPRRHRLLMCKITPFFQAQMACWQTHCQV